MARPRELRNLDCGGRFALAAARVIEVRAAELIEHSRDVLDTDDVERVHDMRVASRRLRAAMEIFAPCFPRKRHRAALKEVKAIADALGERRDRDVALVALAEFASSVGPAERIGVKHLSDRIRGEQERANEDLREFVDEDRLDELRRTLLELAAQARGAVEDRVAV